MRKPDAILTADIHLGEDTPQCWKDDYWEAQGKVIDILYQLQSQYQCPVFVAGDLWHRWNPSLFLVAWAIRRLPKLIVVPGQHDLPHHNLRGIDKTALKVLEEAGKVIIPPLDGQPLLLDPHAIWAVPWGSPFPEGWRRKVEGRKIALAHITTYLKKVPYPGCSADPASRLLKNHPNFDLIITGDNHDAFTVEIDGRLLVNPGSVMRRSAAQMDHQPRVYLWHADTNTVTPHYLPFRKEEITRGHIEEAKTRDERIEAFVSRLEDQGVEIGLSFEKNLRQFMDQKKVKKDVRDLVWEMVGAGKAS